MLWLQWLKMLPVIRYFQQYLSASHLSFLSNIFISYLGCTILSIFILFDFNFDYLDHSSRLNIWSHALTLDSIKFCRIAYCNKLLLYVTLYFLDLLQVADPYSGSTWDTCKWCTWKLVIKWMLEWSITLLCVASQFTQTNEPFPRVTVVMLSTEWIKIFISIAQYTKSDLFLLFGSGFRRNI